MPAGTVEQLLVAWGTWSRVEVEVGPEVAHAACSLEGRWRSPQPWDDDSRRRPRLVLLDDDTAMRVERAVIATGVVLAAALRTVYIRQRPPRTRAEVRMLEEAIRRVGVLLGASGCPADGQDRPQRRAADARATRASPEPF